MNDMSTPVVAAQEMGGSPTSFSMDDAHIFRSKLVDKLAEIEAWITRKFEKFDSDVVGKKPLGQKLAILRKLTEQAEPKFKNPAKARRLLDQLQPFADLRAELAHSTLTIFTTAQQENIVIYENANDAAHPTVKKHGRLTTGQMKHFLKRTEQICDQLKSLQTCK